MKRRSFLTLLPACAFAGSAYGQESAAGTPVQVNGFTIAGVAVNAATNAPLSKALVRIAVSENPQQNRLVVTGPDGRFQFTNLPSHKFVLSVERESGPPHLFLGDGQYSTAIVTGPDQNTSNIVFPYHMPGAITGTVLDDSGEPVPNAQIHVFAREVIDGAPRLVQTGQTNARSSGAFTVGHLKPGIFLIGVSGHPWYADGVMRGVHGAPSVNPPSGLDLVYPFTYYGGALDPAAATPITVTEGSTANIQIVLRAVPAARVTITFRESAPDSQIHVQAIRLGPAGSPVYAASSGGMITNGVGELNGLAPGRYQLLVRQSNPQGGQNAGMGRKIVDIVDGSTIDLSAASRISVKATVKIEGNEPPQNRLSLLLQDRYSGSGVRGVAGPDGVFQFRQATLAPGQYRLLLPNTPAFHVQSMAAKGARIVAGEVLLEDNSDVTLSVTIARNTQSSKLAGFVVRDDVGVVGAMVLLLPQQPGSALQTYRDQTDSDGSFALPNVSAGKYFALAIDNGHDLAYAEPEVIQPYLNAALSVSIADPTQLPTLKIPVQSRVS